MFLNAEVTGSQIDIMGGLEVLNCYVFPIPVEAETNYPSGSRSHKSIR